MKTHQHFLLLFSGLFFCSMMDAQQVYQAHHYGSPGDIYLYNRFAPGLLNDEVIQAGPDVTWDVSGQDALNTHANQILEPGAAINQFNFFTICALSGLPTLDCFEVWENTDQAVQLKDTLLLLDFILHDLQRFQAKEENLLIENFIGFTVDLSGTPTQAVIVYEIPDTIIHFPVNYGDNWTSQTRYGLDLTSVGQNILYSSTQTRMTTIDGWGDLQTPFDTFENVIRLRSDILRVDTIIQNVTDTIFLVADQIEYMWLDTNYTLPVMTANGLITPNDSVILTAVEYIYEATCPTPTWSVNAAPHVFVLDSTGSVEVPFTVEGNNANVYTWDFGDGHFGESTGDVTHTYTAPGIYSIAVTGCMTDCLPLNSCAFQLVTIEVLDSTSAIRPVEGKDIGIRLYPNPGKETLNLFIPRDLGTQHYRISDMTGRILASGNLQEDETQLEIGILPEGMYLIQFNSVSNANAPIAYTTFVKLRE